MGRLVEPRVVTEGLTDSLPPGAVGFVEAMPLGSKGESPDDYKTRVAKYVPVEVVGFYIAANSLLASSAAQGQSWLAGAHIGIFILGLVGTPIYLKKLAKAGQPFGMHLTISFFAFILWAYAIPGGVFTYFKIDNGLLAGLLLITFTFISGMFQPTKTA